MRLETLIMLCFLGRMLHLLPSTVKKEKAETDAGGAGTSSYKRQKDAKSKASSSRYRKSFVRILIKG